MAQRVLAEYVVDIKGNAKDLKSALAEAERNVSQSVKSIGWAMQSLGSSVNQLGQAYAALGAATVAGGLAAVKAASNWEMQTIAFNTLTGSVREGHRFMQEMAQFAASTPFEIQGVQEGAKRLMAYGFAAKQVIPLLTSIGNATSALGTGQEGMNRIILAIGQMRSKTKVYSQEMRQFAESGIPAWEILSKAIGKTVAETQKLVEKGKVSSKVFIDAFSAYSKQNYGGLMEKQAKTIAGTFSNLKDNIHLTLIPIGEAIDNVFDLRAIMSDAIYYMRRFTNYLGSRDGKRYLDELGDKFKDVFKYITEQLDAASGKFFKLQKRIEELTGLDTRELSQWAIVIASMGAVVGPLLVVVGTAITMIGGFVLAVGYISGVALSAFKSIGALGGIVKAVLSPFGLLITALGLAGLAMKSFYDYSEIFRKRVKNAMQNVVEGFALAFDQIKLTFESMGGTMGKFWTDHGNPFRDGAVHLMFDIVNILEKTGLTIAGVMAEIAANMRGDTKFEWKAGGFGPIIDMVDKVSAKIKEFVDEVAKAKKSGKNWTTSLIYGLDTASGAGGRLKDIVSEMGDVFDGLKKHLSIVWENMEKIVGLISDKTGWSSQEILGFVASMALLAVVLSPLVSSLATIVSVGASIAGALGPVGLIIAGMGIYMVDLWRRSKEFREKVSYDFDRVKEAFGAMWEQMKIFWEKYGDDIKKAMDVISGVLIDVLAGTFIFLSGLITMIFAAINGDTEAFKDAFLTIWEGLEIALHQILFGLGDAFVWLLRQMSDMVGALNPLANAIEKITGVNMNLSELGIDKVADILEFGVKEARDDYKAKTDERSGRIKTDSGDFTPNLDYGKLDAETLATNPAAEKNMQILQQNTGKTVINNNNLTVNMPNKPVDINEMTRRLQNQLNQNTG